jgi:hypothetical protein
VRNGMLILICTAITQEYFQQCPQRSKSQNERLQEGISSRNDTIKLSKGMFFISFPITTYVLLLVTIWVYSVSPITVWILQLFDLQRLGRVHIAAGLRIPHSEDGMH